MFLFPGSGADFRPVSDFRLDLQFSVLVNGSLSIAPAAHHHEGQYKCRAENGIGRGLSKVITISVNGKLLCVKTIPTRQLLRLGHILISLAVRENVKKPESWGYIREVDDSFTFRIILSTG